MHKILLVDDDENILHALKRQLKKMPDLEVTTSSDPIAALELVQETAFDIILSDYRMPEMDGVDFLFLTKSYRPDAMRLILSGQADYLGLFGAINKAEVYRFITKPAPQEEVQQAITQALSHYDMQQENKRLSDQVRAQQEELNNRERVLMKFTEEHPELAKVNWTDDGAIYLSEDEL